MIVTRTNPRPAEDAEPKRNSQRSRSPRRANRTPQASSAQPANDFEGGGFFNRLNRRLFPYIGPPPLGPYDQPAPAPASGRACPLCGAPMSDHDFDRSGGANRPTKIYCPT